MSRHLGAFAVVLAVVAVLGVPRTLLAEAGLGQWIVVHPSEFSAELKPLIERRQNEGFHAIDLELPDGPANGALVLARLKETLAQRAVKSYVLLAGATPLIPALAGSVARMKGQGTDAPYGMPDGDGAPTVSVGRFPARDEKELRAMIQKTLRFEENGHPASWQNRLVLLIGDPGGGMIASLYVEATLDADLARLDPSWSVRTLFNAASSRFSYPRRMATGAALGFLREGEFFSVYLGHSNAEGMDFIDRDGWQKVEIPQGNGAFFTCGCFALQSDKKGDGYGLAAMRNAAGPSAVIGATGETYSAAGQLAAEGLLARFATAPFSERLGDYWLAAAAGLARGKMDPATYALLDAVDGSGGKETLATMRLEHLEMWMLLGDPAMRMPTVPQDVLLDATGTVAAGNTLAVSGTLPKRLEGAAVRLTLERPLNSQPADLAEVPALTPLNHNVSLRVLAANNHRANSYVQSSIEAQGRANRFAAELKLPRKLPWSNLVLRASAAISNETGLGIRVLTVKQKP